MAAMSDYLENALLEETLNAVNFAPPASVYIALYTTAPTDAGGGVEVSGGSYARVQVTAGFTVSGVLTRAGNTAAITFAQATANWGTIVAVGIHDAASGGNLLYHGSLTASKTINDTDQLEFPADALGVTLT